MNDAKAINGTIRFINANHDQMSLTVWCEGTGKPQIAASISSETSKISFLFNESKFP